MKILEKYHPPRDTVPLHLCKELEETSDEEERLALYHRLLHTSQKISEERLAINLLGKLTLTRFYVC